MPCAMIWSTFCVMRRRIRLAVEDEHLGAVLLLGVLLRLGGLRLVEHILRSDTKNAIFFGLSVAGCGSFSRGWALGRRSVRRRRTERWLASTSSGRSVRTGACRFAAFASGGQDQAGEHQLGHQCEQILLHDAIFSSFAAYTIALHQIRYSSSVTSFCPGPMSAGQPASCQQLLQDLGPAFPAKPSPSIRTR